MLDEKEIREAFCEVGRRVWTKDYIASNDGNFSFRLDENRVLCTPTMISKGFMKPEDMVIVDLEGNQLAGKRRATSEVRIHLFVYRHRPDVHAVVHVHPPHATAFAVAQRELPKCVLPEIEIFLGEIPLAPYATTGTWEFAQSIAPWVARHDAFLLTNHGAVTVGKDPFDAYYKMETLDQYCRILLLAGRVGDWNRIDGAGMRDLLNLKAKLGIPDTRGATPSCESGVPPGGPPTPAMPGVFRPHPGPLTDEPKLATRDAPAVPVLAPTPRNADDIVEEVLRRLRGR